MNLDSYKLVGAGNYGIVIQTNPHEVLKLFKHPQDFEALKKEAAIQHNVYTLFKDSFSTIHVPLIAYSKQEHVVYGGVPHLCGIAMQYVEPPDGFDSIVHILLGYKGSDIDAIWGMRIGEPVSEINPPRGFFASIYTLEDIWETEGSDMSIEVLAYWMGKAHRRMLDNGILPIDLEWVWSKGSLWVIDFGLCEYGRVDPIAFLENESSWGLKHDLYIPHKGDRGYEDFMRGYLET
jgi:hypothetical protein